MIGKIAVAGVAGVAAYNTLKGMDAEGIRGVATKVQDMVHTASEKAGKSEFLQSVKSTLESTKVGSVMLGAASGLVRSAETGVSKFFEIAAAAKEQADKGEGTFGKNMAKGALDKAAGGLQSAVATGFTQVAEKLGFAPQTMPADAAAAGVEAGASVLQQDSIDPDVGYSGYEPGM